MLDAIIVGSGHNGLVCAAYLAKAGKRVQVLEQRNILGGGAITEELIPGYWVSSCAHAVGMFRPEISHELKLGDYGFEMYTSDPYMLVVTEPDQGLLFWGDLARTWSEQPDLTEQDWTEYHRFLGTIGQVAAVLDPTFLQPPLSESQLRQRFIKAGLLHGYEWAFEYSLVDFLNLFQFNERLKLGLATLGMSMQFASANQPGTAFSLFRFSTAEVNGYKGAWGFVRGGTGRLTQALVQAGQQLGVTFRTDAEVVEIIVENGRATGVRLKNGEIIHSSLVISNADPKRTFRLLPSITYPLMQEEVNPLHFKMRGGGMKILCALSGLPEFKAFPGSTLVQQAGAIVIAPSMAYVEQAWVEAEQGRPSQHPVIELTLQTVTDTTLTPPGHHVMSIHVQWTPYHLSDGTWAELTEPYADHVLRLLAEYMPNLPQILIARKVISPLDFEQTFGMTEGHWEHGEMIPDQIFTKRFSYETPLPGLYLCGAGTHPGGTISGAPGYNAAHHILGRKS